MTSRSVYVRTAVDEVDVPGAYAGGVVVDVCADRGRSTLSHSIEEIPRRVGLPRQQVTDFLLLAAAVYVADKCTPRSRADDAWTRKFRLRLPVADKDRWSAVSDELAQTLSYLTGDIWTVSFLRRRNALPRTQALGQERYDAVCLFSGGLDSLAGAIRLLASSRGRVLLVGHHDSGQIEPVQKRLAARLGDHFGRSRVDLVSVLLRPAPQTPGQEYPLPRTVESSTRSRSVVFLALALAAASAIAPDVPVVMPENGYVSLNVPITGGRLGSLSTRTTHPYFMSRLRSVLDGLEIRNPIENPFALMSKGDILVRSPKPELIQRLAPDSISCAHPEANRYNPDPSRRRIGNCGYCYPCIIRRAAMRRAGWDMGSEYTYDVLREESLIERGGNRGQDVRALVAMLSDRRGLSTSPLSVLRGGPLPASLDMTAVARMQARGNREIREFFDAATSRVKRRMDLS